MEKIILKRFLKFLSFKNTKEKKEIFKKIKNIQFNYKDQFVIADVKSLRIRY